MPKKTIISGDTVNGAKSVVENPENKVLETHYSWDTVNGAKSIVEIFRDQVIKTFIDRKDAEGAPEDPVLRAHSCSKSPRYYYHKEEGMLRTLTENCPKGRLTPERYSSDHKDLKIVMEKLTGETYRDALAAAKRKNQDTTKVIEDVPEKVAEIHWQLRTYEKELRESVQWGSKKNPTIGLKVRGKESERDRFWHYLRAIIYSMSPELLDLRERALRNVSKNALGVINRDLKSYLQHKKGIDIKKFTEDFVRRDFELMYDFKTSDAKDDHEKFEQKVESLLEQRRLSIVQGDLGPQHLYKSGRYLDLDEARIAPGETDLVSSIYNMFTYPRSDEEELKLMELSFKYQREMKQKEPTAEERTAFATRLVEARLKESLRLFASDCKAPLPVLRKLTEGLPEYEELKDENLRQKLLINHFVNGLSVFLHFYTRGAGWTVLSQSQDGRSHLLYDQLTGVEEVFTRLKVFEGAGDEGTIQRLEELLKIKK